ncbi:MAG: GHKL domain-containing protein [Hahellaceae bacterium]|nr:GHKL domain-containing protein [Hahellaceae bacterium]
MSLSTTTVLEALPAGVIILNAKGCVKECNPAAVALLGEPLIGERWAAVIERSFAPQEDDGHEVSLKDGRKLSVQTCSLENGPGQLVLLYDVTETRVLQSKVARNERLSLMGKMVASLAHQIRTPLSAAMLYASQLTNPNMTPELVEKCSRKLVSRLNHLEQQVKDMLMFARGDCPLAERLSIEALFQSIQAAAEPAVAGLQWHLEGGDHSLVCNRESLVGGVMNLINNAIEACLGSENPRIDVSVVALNGSLLISVQDNGQGFDEVTARRLKEAFFTTKGQGTGLGLAVVDGIARAHHGLFRITSPGRGQGASAVLVLPLHHGESSVIPMPKATPKIAQPESAVLTGGYAHV